MRAETSNHWLGLNDMWTTIIFLVLGVTFPLLLNGQTFTNNILGSTFCIAAGVLGLRSARKAQLQSNRAEHVCLCLLGFGLGLFLVAGLPAAYESQQRFNKTMDEIRQKNMGLNVPDDR